MNRQIHRIVFNRVRGLLMVVAENVRAQGAGSGSVRSDYGLHGSVLDTGPFLLRCLPVNVALMYGSLMVLPAHAAVVAYKPALKTQQATILNAGNGVPLVNIQTPSATGVSHNKYSQFDVGQEGVILNNSRTNVHTLLGGWVQGNPWLAGGAARVILNEVISSNPSQLLGYIEVAGSRAEVIIANPAGIACDGCGFINANQATLTTGRPKLSNGNLDGYRVEGGTVTIQGGGFDASRTDYANLIARAVQVNAGIWANELRVTAGTNLVDVANSSAIPIAGNSSSPAFGIDVAQLGGMYAGKITLVGTEAGVGVRNAGEIGASGSALVLSADGRLQNSGRLISEGDIGITVSGPIENRGTLYSRSNATLVSDGMLENHGTIAAMGDNRISTGGHIIGGASSLFAAGLNTEGSLANSGNLMIEARQWFSVRGRNLAGADQTLTGSHLQLGGSETVGRNLTLLARDGDFDASDAKLSAAATLSVNTLGRLNTDGAEVVADQLNLKAHALSNIGGVLLHTGSGDFSLSLLGNLNNTGGRIAANAANLSLGANAFDNTDGIIQHAGSGSFSVNAVTMQNHQGEILSAGSLKFVAENLANQLGLISAVGSLDAGITHGIDNRQGNIKANQGVGLRAAGPINNGNGLIESAHGAISLTAKGAFDNHDGDLITGKNIQLESASLDNANGEISGFDIDLSMAGLLANTGTARILALNDLSLESGSLNNQQQLQAGRHMSVSNSGALDNSGTVYVQGNARVSSKGDIENRGVIAAMGDNHISAGGSISGDATSLFAAGLKADGKLANSGNLMVEAGKALSALGQNLASADQTLSGSSLDLGGSETIGRNLTESPLMQ